MYFKKTNSSLWSWILQLFSSIKSWVYLFFFPKPPTPEPPTPKTPKTNLSSLSGELIGHIISYLEPHEFLKGVIIPKKSLWSIFEKRVVLNNPVSGKEIYLKLKASDALFHVQLNAFYKFFTKSAYLFQIESYLEHQKKLIQKAKIPQESINHLISYKVGMIYIKNQKIQVSAYGYAFFNYQNQKNKMLDKYIDTNTKIKVKNECEIIKSYDIKRLIEDDMGTQNSLSQLL